MKLRHLLLAALSTIGCSGEYPSGHDNPGSDWKGNADYGQVEEAITSTVGTGGGQRISGYVLGPLGVSEGVQCTKTLGENVNCVLPRSLAVGLCFEFNANADARIRTQAALVAASLNSAFAGGVPAVPKMVLRAGVNGCQAGDVRIIKAVLSNDGLPATDIRHYGSFSSVLGPTALTEPTPISGIFSAMASSAPVAFLTIDTAAIDAQSTNATVRNRMIHHTLGHHLIRRYGLGTTGSGNLATHMSNSVNNDSVVHSTLHAAQICLVNTLNLSNPTQMVLAAPGACPSFPAGM